jgi:glycosyltransferase involved in cell wall biosynthesis
MAVGSPKESLALAAMGPLAPSYRVRVELPARVLRRQGIQLRRLPLFTAAEARDLEAGGALIRTRTVLQAHRRLAACLRHLAGTSDVAFVQRHVGILPTLRLESLAQRGRRLVLDIDDPVWLATLPEAGGHGLALLKRAAHKVKWLARRADTVIAGNPVLAEWLGRYSKNVIVVPSLVDPTSIATRRHAQASQVVWGWIGSRSTSMHLRSATETLAAAAAALADIEIELLIIGANHEIRVPGITVRQVPWTEEREKEALTRIDIGLMPLPDNDWTRQKCAYKALVYMTAGVPVVADDVGVSADVIGHDSGGLISRGKREWIEALATLSREAEFRQRLGAGARRRVEEKFSVQRWAPVLATALAGRTHTTDAAAVERPSIS